jgi:hypothetical protein
MEEDGRAREEENGEDSEKRLKNRFILERMGSERESRARWGRKKNQKKLAAMAIYDQIRECGD